MPNIYWCNSFNRIFSLMYLFFLGRKGLEPSMACAIEFTAQPVIPTNGTFLFNYGGIVNVISPVQFPLHEPYFDLTLIGVTHTKINYLLLISLFVYNIS